MRIPLIGSSPIRKNLLANLFGTGVQFFNQIILVPFFILFWGNELYSDWIVLTAFSSVFAMSDIGMNNVIQNRFAIKKAEGNFKECNSLLTDNYILLFLIFIIVFILSCGYVTLFDITDHLNIHQLSRSESNLVFLLLLFRVFIDMFRTVVNAIYRAAHAASRAIMLDQGINFIVTLLILVCILLKFSIICICFVMIIPLAGMIVFKNYDVQKYYNYKFAFADYDNKLLKQIFVPAISFMSFPAGNAIVLQGYTMVVNSLWGAEPVVLYNTTRTLCNFCKTLLNSLQNSVWPEYSIAFGMHDFERMRHLHRKLIKITVVASSMIGVLLLLLGPFVYDFWTHGSVSFSHSLLAIYVIVLFFESLWMSSSVTLMATNNHVVLGVVYVLSTFISLSVGILVGKADGSLPLLASTLIILHVIMCIYTIPSGYRLTKDSFLRSA